MIAALIPVTSPTSHQRHRHLRDQVQGRGRVLAAPHEPEHDDRNRPRDARRPEEAGRARGRAPGRRAAEHSAGERPDGAMRPDGRHRRPRHGQSGLRIRQAGVRRRRRERDNGDRRDGTRGRSRAQLADQQDQRQRVRLLGRRKPARTHASTIRSSRSSRKKAAISSAKTRNRGCRPPIGTPRGDEPPTRSRATQASSRRKPASRYRTARRSSSSPSG